MLHFALNWSQFFCVYERWANNLLSKSDYFLCMCVSLCQHNTFITIWFVVVKEFKDCPKTKMFLKVIVTSIYIQTYRSSLSLSCSLLLKLLCDEILRTEIIILKIFCPQFCYHFFLVGSSEVMKNYSKFIVHIFIKKIYFRVYFFVQLLCITRL